MEDGVDVLDCLAAVVDVADVAHLELEGGVGAVGVLLEEGDDVLPFAGGEVVEAADGVALLEEVGAEVGADEAGSAGYEDFFHISLRCVKIRDLLCCLRYAPLVIYVM